MISHEKSGAFFLHAQDGSKKGAAHESAFLHENVHKFMNEEL